tara:strand:- start:8065 stop:8520 length:456 start_codon:yes stop_codon:yes gene_type:complete
MGDISAEVAALKAQLAALTTAAESAGVKLEAKTIYVVHNPYQRAIWCPNIDCQTMGRKTTYDVVKENPDPEAEDIIMTGVSKEASEEKDVKRKVKRVGTPTVSLDNLGVIAAFTTKKKALDFMDNYFRLNQRSITGDGDQELQMTEVIVNS